MAQPCGLCNVECSDGRRFNNVSPSSDTWSGQGGGAQMTFQCCYGLRQRLCGKDFGSADSMGLTMGGSGTITRPPRTGEMVFRGADGKMLEGKQEILGVELPKVLIVAGVAVAAYFIVKKMK